MAINVEVKIGAVTLRNREIEHLEIAQELGGHHRLSITFHRDPSKPLQLANFVAPPVTVSLTDDATDKKVQAFVGTGSTCEERHQLQGGSHFLLTALSESADLAVRHHFLKFPDAVLSDIVKSYVDVKLTAPPFQRKADYAQGGTDDFSFLVRLADDHQCFVRPLEAGIEIRHGFDDKRHELVFGKNLLALTSRIAAKNHRFKAAFYEWQKKEEVLLRDRSADAPATGATKLTDAVKQAASGLNGGIDPNVFENDARIGTLGELRDAMLRESERVLGAAVTIEGESTNPELLIGDTVDIQAGTKHKLEDPPGTVGLVKVTHRFDGHQYTNTFTATPWAHFDNAVQPAPRVLPGLVSAEVMDNVDPLNAGRILVREAGGDNKNNAKQFFARQITPFAGNERGIAFLPEIGDEVMLGYEEGDPERPYVMGSVWNGRDVSPGHTPKRIVTKSGNSIVMDDGGLVEIYSPGGNCMVQLSSGVGGVPRVTIHSEGDLFLEAKENIQIKCKNLFEYVDADLHRDVQGNEVSVVLGDRTSDVEGNDTLVAQGRMYLAVGGSSIELNKAMVSMQGNEMMSIASTQNIVAGAMVQLNPPGIMAMPLMLPDTEMPSARDSSWGGRAVPKKTDPFKVSRDDSPKS